MLAFGLFGIPILICALLGVQKGRSWFWFAPLGLLSFLGVLIANSMRSNRSVESVTDLFVGVPAWRLPVLRAASRVKVVEGAIDGSQVLGRIEVDLFEPLPGRASTPPDFMLAVDALRVRAAELGANVVHGAVCVRTDELPWSGEPQTVYRLSGAAMSAQPIAYRAVQGDVTAITPDSYIGEPWEQPPLHPEWVSAGMASWAVASGVPASVRGSGVRSVYRHLMRLQADARAAGHLRRTASVPVISGEPGIPYEPACELTISEYVDLSSSTGVDAGLALDHLRMKAVGAGANAVVKVTCTHSKPRFWEDKSCGQARISGLAVRIEESRLAEVRSDADSIQLMIYPREPTRVATGNMLFDGIAFAGLSLFCVLCVYDFLHPDSGGPRGASGRWLVPPIVCYALLTAEMLTGIGLAVKRTPETLTLSAQLAMAIGAILVISPNQAIWGACQVVWGLSRTLRYRQIWRGLRDYQDLKAALETQDSPEASAGEETNN